MNEAVKILLIGLVVLFSHVLEGITGFGCIVIALPFITMLLGIKMTVPMLCVMSWCMAVFIVWRSWRSIQWKEFLFIAVFAGLGMPAGIIMFDKMSPTGLCLLLGCFMIGVGIQGTCVTLKQKKAGKTPKKAQKNFLMKVILFCGGIIHGAFGTGGPFVVIYAAKALTEKSLFRVTLSMLWLLLNSSRLAVWTIQGNIWTVQIWKYILYTFPFLLCGILLGDYLHHKVNEFVFRLCVYGMLTLSGAVMLYNNLLKLCAF